MVFLPVAIVQTCIHPDALLANQPRIRNVSALVAPADPELRGFMTKGDSRMIALTALFSDRQV